MAKETLVNKNDTFEDWRQKSNDVSLDLGAVASDNEYAAKSLDTESRLTDQYISKSDLGDGGIYIRDVSSLPNGMEIDYSPGRSVDNTDGYIILKDGVTNSGDFLVGDRISQYAGDNTGNAAQFNALIVSISNKKILIESVTGTESFDTSLNLYKTTDATKLIAASRLKELIVESYDYGNVRVYRTRNYNFDATAVTANKIQLSAAAYAVISEGDVIKYTTPTTGGIFGTSDDVTIFYVKKDSADAAARKIKVSTVPDGADATLMTGTGTQILSTNRLALQQDITAEGFHIARHGHYVPHSASSIPVTFVEGEVLYQGSSSSPSFQGTLLTADISGVLIFKNILDGTYDPTEDLISTTVVNGAGATLSGAAITIANADLTGALVNTSINYAQMVEFNSPGVAGDDYKVYFGSAVDAVLELQDDVGTVENLNTNANDDLTVAVNELEVAIRGASNNLVSSDLTTTANDLKSAINEHEADLFGQEGANKRTLSSLGTNEQASIVDAINELETAIRGNGANLVSSDLGTALSSYDGTATNLLDAVEELYADVGDVTNTNLGTKVGDESEITAKIKAIDDFISDTSLTDNNNVNLATTHTVTDTLAKLITLIGTDEDWKQVGTTNQTIGVVQGSANPTVTLSAANPAIKIGQTVTGNDIQSNTVVQNINGVTLTLSQASAGALQANATLTFTEADTLVNVIEFIHREIGDVKALNDDNLGNTSNTPGDLTTAINTIKAFIGTADISDIHNGSDNTITSALDQLYTDIGDVGTSGSNLSATTGFSATDLKSAVVELQGDMGDVDEINDTVGYSGATAVAGIKEIQTYLGDVSTLSNSGDIYTADAHASATGTGTTTLNLETAATYTQTAGAGGSTNGDDVDVGYQVSVGGSAVGTIIEKTSNTVYVLSATHTVSNGTTITFTEPSGYGFASDVVTDSLIALRTALVGGTADLDDKIATLDDSDGAETDFAAANIVDAIRELQDDLGRTSQISNTNINTNVGPTFNSDTIKDSINSITATIGTTDISAVDNDATDTITSAIAQLYTDIGDVGASGVNLTTTATDLTAAINEHETDLYTSTAGSFTGLSSTNFKAAIEETIAEIGDVTEIDDSDYYSATTVVDGIKELQTSVGAGSDYITLGTNNGFELVTVDNAGGYSVGDNTINLDSSAGASRGMLVAPSSLGAGFGNSSIADGTIITFAFGGTTPRIILSKNLIGPLSDGDTFYVVAADIAAKVGLFDSRIGNITLISDDSTGYTNSTVVGGIRQIQDKIGHVTAANLGTASSTLVTAIKEINDNYLDASSTGSTTILGDISLSTGKTLTVPSGATIDVSAGTLITSDADADFNIVSKAAVISGSTQTMGVIIERENIVTNSGTRILDDVGGVQQTGDTNAAIMWDERRLIASHAEEDSKKRGWVITGITAGGDEYTQPLVDLETIQYIFADNVESNITVDWDDTNKNFDISLNATGNDLTSGGSGTDDTWGTAAKVPQLDIDRQGRIIGVTEVSISGALGEFTLQADGATQQTIGVTDIVKIAGTTNEIETLITESSGTNTITVGLPDDVTITNNLSVGNNLTVSGDIVSGGSSFTFNSTSATVSSAQLILNSSADNVILDTPASADQTYIPAAAFVAHRGFEDADITGGVGTLTIGKRYRIDAAGHTITTTQQTALREIGGLDTSADDLVDNSVITAATTGHSTIGNTTGITLHIQKDEAKIAWNETDDTWDLYRGSDTVAGSIIAQGDTIGSSTKYTSDETDDDGPYDNYRVLFSGDADAATNAAKIDILRSDDGFFYNADANAITLVGGNSKIIAEGGTSKLGALEVNSLLVGKDATAATTAGEAKIQGYFGRLKLKEHATASELSNNSSVANPEWSWIADGGSLSARLNNTSPYAISINTNANRNSITDVVLTAVDGIKFKNNDASTGADTLSHTVNSTKTNASFIGKTQYGSSSLNNNLDIQDVRITGQSAEAQTAANASKRIQHCVGSSNYSFIDLQGAAAGDNEIRLGGYYGSTVKNFFKGNVKGSAELYHNTDNTDASDLTLKTVNDGMRYYGTLITNFDEPVTRYNDTDTTSVFKGATPVADLQGPWLTGSGIDQATNVVIRNGSHSNTAAARTVGLTLTNGPARNQTDNSSIDNVNNFKKGVDLYIKSESSYGVEPDFFIDRSDGNKRVLINYEGDIGFYNQSATQTVKFKWDANNARLGVGTDAPSADLHVTSGVGANGSCTLLVEADSNNDSSNEESVPIIELNSDAGGSIGRFYNTGSAITAQNKLVNSTIISRLGHSDSTEAQNALQFATGGNTGIGDIARMTITYSGKVGINTTAPSEQFEVNGAAKTTSLTTTADIIVGITDGKRGTGTLQVADIVGKGTDSGAHGNKSSIRLHAGESKDVAGTQDDERVYINAEGGLEINSSPNGWDNATDQAWENRNTTHIGKTDGSSEFGGKISHQGLTLMPGREIDQIYSITRNTGTTDFKTDWVDTTIEGNVLETGSYIIQLYVAEQASEGVWNETYTGVMSWHGTNTNSELGDEIMLHNAGHASREYDDITNPSYGGWFLRTLRTPSVAAGGEAKLKLQIRSDHDAVDNKEYTIKLRRML